jgi:hypothetical protein
VEREGVTILTNDYDEVDALLHSICKFVCPLSSFIFSR